MTHTKMAIRWASDRIEQEQGIIAFRHPGSWIDGNVESGIRACLAEEFSSVLCPKSAREMQEYTGSEARPKGKGVFGSGAPNHPLLSRSSSRTQTPHTMVVKSTTEILVITSNARETGALSEGSINKRFQRLADDHTE